jgi:GNAT superfamily N-acetyltransferase
MEINITRISDWNHKKKFIDFPHDLYKDNPYYVPELFITQKKLLDERKNPFFKHSKAALFLAWKGGNIVGRIAAIRNNEYIRFASSNLGFFGFFDTVESYDVAEALLNTASDWLRKEGLNGMLGPTNFTTNDVAGLLVEGFDLPPAVMMPYNFAYYVDFLERFGLKPKMDLLAYYVNKETANMKSLDLAQSLEERLVKRSITVRTLKRREFQQELENVKEVYSSAWDKNWGFVPPTVEEFNHLAVGLKTIIDPDLALLAENEEKLIGFALAIPDINLITRNIERGRLFPFGIFKLLAQRKRINRIRVILLGVIEKYRRMGIEGIFYAHIIRNALNKGYTEAEASWILESNILMRRGVESVNMKPVKRYRLYEKSFNNPGTG